MAGGTAPHSLISGNWNRELGNALKDRPCLVFNSDMMVLCPTGLRTYPDVSVTRDSPRYESDKQLTLLSPQVIVEVLSDSTEAYDRGRKFDHYKRIESFREYVLVATDRAHIDHFARQADGRWVLTAYDGLEATAELLTHGVRLPLAELYRGVDLPATGIQAAQ
jgi:Uma2 family endonuclease